jgi:hypothetical protein
MVASPLDTPVARHILVQNINDAVIHSFNDCGMLKNFQPTIGAIMKIIMLARSFI